MPLSHLVAIAQNYPPQPRDPYPYPTQPRDPPIAPIIRDPPPRRRHPRPRRPGLPPRPPPPGRRPCRGRADRGRGAGVATPGSRRAPSTCSGTAGAACGSAPPCRVRENQTRHDATCPMLHGEYASDYATLRAAHVGYVGFGPRRPTFPYATRSGYGETREMLHMLHSYA